MRPPPSTGTRMTMHRPSLVTSSGPSPVRGFMAAMDSPLVSERRWARSPLLLSLIGSVLPDRPGFAALMGARQDATGVHAAAVEVLIQSAREAARARPDAVPAQR